MRVLVEIENADKSLLDALRAVLKVRRDLHFSIVKEKEKKLKPSKRLLNAIKEVQNGEVVSFATHAEAMKYLNAND